MGAKSRKEKLINTLDKVKEMLIENEEDNVDILNNLNLIYSEVISKNYGLVFERHQEKALENLKKELPYFMEHKTTE